MQPDKQKTLFTDHPITILFVVICCCVLLVFAGQPLFAQASEYILELSTQFDDSFTALH